MSCWSQLLHEAFTLLGEHESSYLIDTLDSSLETFATFAEGTAESIDALVCLMDSFRHETRALDSELGLGGSWYVGHSNLLIRDGKEHHCSTI